MGELTKRVLVAIFGIPLVVFLIFKNSWYFLILLIVISGVALWEFYGIQSRNEIKPQKYAGILLSLLLLILNHLQNYTALFILAVFGAVWIFISEMLRMRKNAGANMAFTFLGIIYIPVLLGLMINLRRMVELDLYSDTTHAGFYFLMSVIASIWICDSFAYGFGSWFGKHKLIPKVSPNKSVEGSVAGYIGGVLAFWLVMVLDILPIGWLEIFLFGSVVGIIGQLGDLVESWFKRDAGVKDTSALFPGHGGMLDRFDSLIMVTPVMLVVVYLLINI